MVADAVGSGFCAYHIHTACWDDWVSPENRRKKKKRKIVHRTPVPRCMHSLYASPLTHHPLERRAPPPPKTGVLGLAATCTTRTLHSWLRWRYGCAALVKPAQQTGFLSVSHSIQSAVLHTVHSNKQLCPCINKAFCTETTTATSLQTPSLSAPSTLVSCEMRIRKCSLVLLFLSPLLFLSCCLLSLSCLGLFGYEPNVPLRQCSLDPPSYHWLAPCKPNRNNKIIINDHQRTEYRAPFLPVAPAMDLVPGAG